MTTVEQTLSGTVPGWSIGDRMRKAREHARLSQSQLAHRASIGRTSVVRYETGASRPSRPALLAWSLATGVSYEWMCHEDTDPCGPQNRRSEGYEDASRGGFEYMQSTLTCAAA